MKAYQFSFAVGTTSISRYLSDMSITNAATIKRPRLTERHIANREHFADGIELDERYNLPWLFTDECSIDVNPYRTTAWRIPRILVPDGVFQDYAKYPLHIMVWGGIAHNEKSPLI
jgi:hypothetical protein